jgi:Tfp pilus assembly protein PilN
MIEINLLPEELKAKAKAKKIAMAIELKYFLYLIPFIFGILVCIYIYLIGLNLAKNRQLAMLNAKWQKLEPERKTLEDFKKRYALTNEDARAVEQLTKENINWSEKLNKLSLLLPYKIWFNELSISPREFVLHGSVVSLQKEGMGLITEFIDRLKKDAAFSGDFKNLELSSTQWKTIGGYDIVDFVLDSTINVK